MQTEELGIQFDYKKEFHRFWQINAVCIGLSLFSIAKSSDSYDSFFHSNNMPIDLTNYFVAATLENFITIQISISFTILLRSLYMRFAMLNKCLRYTNMIINNTFN